MGDESVIIYNVANKVYANAWKFDPKQRNTRLMLGDTPDFIELSLKDIDKTLEMCKKNNLTIKMGSEGKLLEDGEHLIEKVANSGIDYYNISILDDTEINLDYNLASEPSKNRLFADKVFRMEEKLKKLKFDSTSRNCESQIDRYYLNLVRNYTQAIPDKEARIGKVNNRLEDSTEKIHRHWNQIRELYTDATEAIHSAKELFSAQDSNTVSIHNALNEFLIDLMNAYSYIDIANNKDIDLFGALEKLLKIINNDTHARRIYNISKTSSLDCINAYNTVQKSLRDLYICLRHVKDEVLQIGGTMGLAMAPMRFTQANYVSPQYFVLKPFFEDCATLRIALPYFGYFDDITEFYDCISNSGIKELDGLSNIEKIKELAELTKHKIVARFHRSDIDRDIIDCNIEKQFEKLNNFIEILTVNKVVIKYMSSIYIDLFIPNGSDTEDMKNEVAQWLRESNMLQHMAYMEYL